VIDVGDFERPVPVARSPLFQLPIERLTLVRGSVTLPLLRLLSAGTLMYREAERLVSWEQEFSRDRSSA